MVKNLANLSEVGPTLRTNEFPAPCVNESRKGRRH